MTLSVHIAFTHFGLVLFKAPVMIMQLVSEWLERRFDCRICHLNFQRFELRKIVESALEISYNQPQGHSKYFLTIMNEDNVFVFPWSTTLFFGICPDHSHTIPCRSCKGTASGTLLFTPTGSRRSKDDNYITRTRRRPTVDREVCFCFLLNCIKD